MSENTPTDWLGLSGARILVAGSGGFGLACIETLLAVGATLFVVDRDDERLALAREIAGFAASGSRAEVVDLTAIESGEDAIARAEDAIGPLDGVVHLIGINDRRPVLEYRESEWELVMEVNFMTAFRLGQAAGRRMLTRRQGSIVFVSSVSGLLAHKDHAPYAASKGAINQMARVMANEWAADGVTVNLVAPGYSETPLTRAHLDRPGVREGLVGLVPAGRLGTSEEIADAIAFLLSPRSRYITGNILYVDGGRTLV